MKIWRKTRVGLNWAKGRNMIVNINPAWKVNKKVGYRVSLYDFSRGHNPRLIGKELKVLKTKPQAIVYAKNYMKKH